MVAALIMVMAALAMGNSGTRADGSTSAVAYGDVSLSGGYQAGHFVDIWDLTASDMTLEFTYDGNGLVDDSGAHAWSELGVRACGYGDFNPTYGYEGAGVWLATDYDWTANTFDPDPQGAPTLDGDDKLILQKGGGMGEGAYNLPSTPPNPGANHAVWFDRDGVDQWQALMWGAIDGVTYNTGGYYDVVIALHATSDSSAEAYMTINGEPQGFYDPAWHSGPADLMPAGMTFTGDMMHLQVFYGLYGYGATHSVAFNDIVVTGNHDTYTLAFDGLSDSIVLADTDAKLKVRVTDSDGDPEPGVTVKFADGPDVTFTPTSAVTDDDGHAEVLARSSVSQVVTIQASICNSYTATWVLVICEPGGMTASGGWYYPLDDSGAAMPGTASFGFIAKYLKGSPQGNIEFQYQAGDINLKSTEITWLAVSKTLASFKGVARLNGVDGFYFMVKAKDFGEPGVGTDVFMIWIWDGNPDLPETQLVHHSSNVLAGGNIIIKT